MTLRPAPQPRRRLIPKTLTYALASLAFSIPAAWLATYIGCEVYAGARLCAWPGLYPAVAALAAMLVLAPIGAIYRGRAQRRAARGMWQKTRGPGSGVRGWLTTFERTVQVVWGSELEPPDTLITGEMRWEQRGWWLSVKSGRRVWVNRWELWQWLAKVEALAATLYPFGYSQGSPAGESPIGERRWQPVIGRDLWLAYMDILEAVGAVEYPTDDLRSRRYVRGQPWGRVEEFEKMRGSEARWNN